MKYRNGLSGGHPLEAVDAKKQKTIARCARMYLMKQGFTEIPCRFDVVGITKDEIHLVKNAFEAY